MTLISPNGGDTLEGCGLYTISWTEAPVIGTYDIAYSTNSGGSWTDIETGYATAFSSYDWTVPNIDSDEVLVRVRSTATSSTFDLSDALFSIHSNAIEASPKSITACPGEVIPLMAFGGDNYSWTPTSGVSNDTIANPTATVFTSTDFVVSSSFGGCILTDTVVVIIEAGPDTAAVVITATSSTSICAGENVDFIATPTHGGTTPAYQWKVNGFDVGLDTNVFSSAILADGDLVSCTMTSTLFCVGGNPAPSNAISISVATPDTPSVSLSALPAGIICAGDTVHFMASATHTGLSPAYQWKLNGAPVGSDTSFYASSTLVDGDVILVEMTSSESCVSAPVAISVPDTIGVAAGAPAMPGVISGDTVVCETDSAVYSIAVVPDADVYTWTLPSGWVGSSATESIEVGTAIGVSVLSVTASNGCGTSPAQSLAVEVLAAPSVSFSPLAAVCSDGTAFTLTGGSPTGGIYSGAGVTSDSLFTPALAGIGIHSITYTYTDPAGCSNSSTSDIEVDLCTTTEANIEGETLSVYPNPFSQNFIIEGSDLQKVTIYNALGQQVYEVDLGHAGQYIIDASGFALGTYMLRVVNGDEVVQRQIVKKE